MFLYYYILVSCKIPLRRVFVQPLLRTLSPSQICLGTDSVLRSPLVLDGRLEPCIDEHDRAHRAHGIDVDLGWVSHDVVVIVVTKTVYLVGGASAGVQV